MDQPKQQPQKAPHIQSNMSKGDQEVLQDVQEASVELQQQEVGMMLLKPNKRLLDKSEMTGRRVKKRVLNPEGHLILIHGVKIQAQTKNSTKITEVLNAFKRSQQNCLSNRHSREHKQSRALYLLILELEEG